jgi:hypothetical protein
MSTTGNASLDGIDLMQTAETPWSYPDNVVVTPLLGTDAFTTGNAVLQSSALTVLTKQITFTTDDPTDIAAFLADRYAGAEVTYIDPDGAMVANAVITTLQANRSGAGLYECTATLIQAPASGS